MMRHRQRPQHTILRRQSQPPVRRAHAREQRLVAEHDALARPRRARAEAHERRIQRRKTILEERNRLAREIHDTLAQGLTAITLQLETADALLDAGAPPERSQQAVAQALSLARANLERSPYGSTA